MSIRKIPYADPYITEEDIAAVAEAVKNKRLSQGEYVAKFEKEFSNHLNRKHAIAVTNGTAALHLAVLASGIKPKDEVIIPSFTFAATANCVLYVGAKPVFVDIDSNTYNIDPVCVEKAISPKTKAIIMVHYGGQTADMDPILELAEKHDIRVIEDATEAHGATYKNRKAGTMAEIGCFSFYPNKNMTTGEGGMLATDDDKIAENVRLLRNHGQDYRFHHIMIGYNYKMTDILASLGLTQLSRLEWVLQKKKEAANFYEELLSSVSGVQPPYIMSGATHTYMFYTVKFLDKSTRDRVMQYLNQKGVETVIAFPPLHLQPVYMYLDKSQGDYLNATEDCANKVLSLPIYPHISRHDQKFIIESMLEELIQ